MAARDRNRRRKELEAALRKLRKRGPTRPAPSVPDRLPFGGPDILVNPPGLDRMSDVLEEFVDPYLDEATSLENLHALLMKGAAAWNAAVAPAGERRDRLVTGLLESLRGTHSADEIAAVRRQVEELIHRKLTVFPLISRCIVGVELSMTDDGPHIRVASTLEAPPDLGIGDPNDAT